MGYDTKYGKVTLEHGHIPDDEPVFVLRARDVNAMNVLSRYRELCEGNGSPAHHNTLIERTMDKFRAWRENNRIRTPRSDHVLGVPQTETASHADRTAPQPTPTPMPVTPTPPQENTGSVAEQQERAIQERNADAAHREETVQDRNADAAHPETDIQERNAEGGHPEETVQERNADAAHQGDSIQERNAGQGH